MSNRKGSNVLRHETDEPYEHAAPRRPSHLFVVPRLLFFLGALFIWCQHRAVRDRTSVCGAVHRRHAPLIRHHGLRRVVKVKSQNVEFMIYTVDVPVTQGLLRVVCGVWCGMCVACI